MEPEGNGVGPRPDASAQSDMEPVDILQKRLAEMRELAALYREEDVSNAYPGISEELTWAADKIEQLAALAQSNAEPHPDASAGLIEAANDIEKKANRERHFAASVAKNARARLIHRHRAEAFEEALRVLHAHAADRSAK